MTQETVRRPVAPLRLEAFLGADEIAAIGRVQPVGVGPALMHAAPGIAPVVVDLAAQQVATDAPEVLVPVDAQHLLALPQGTIVTGQVQDLPIEAPVLQMEVMRVDAEGIGLRFIER